MSKGMSIADEAEKMQPGTSEEAGGQSVARAPQRAKPTLHELLAGVELRSSLPANDLAIQQVTCDSRKAAPGSLFVAIHGVATDGNLFARDAAKRGAVAIISHQAPPTDWPTEVVWLQVEEPRKALAITAANFFGRPADELKLVGVTGTNGKTTTTSLIDSIVRASGAKTGLFGTIAYHTPVGEYPAPNTTPESVDLQAFFAEVCDAGGRFAVL